MLRIDRLNDFAYMVLFAQELLFFLQRTTYAAPISRRASGTKSWIDISSKTWRAPRQQRQKKLLYRYIYIYIYIYVVLLMIYYITIFMKAIMWKLQALPRTRVLKLWRPTSSFTKCPLSPST